MKLETYNYCLKTNHYATRSDDVGGLAITQFVFFGLFVKMTGQR